MHGWANLTGHMAFFWVAWHIKVNGTERNPYHFHIQGVMNTSFSPLDLVVAYILQKMV